MVGPGRMGETGEMGFIYNTINNEKYIFKKWLSKKHVQEKPTRFSEDPLMNNKGGKSFFGNTTFLPIFLNLKE